MTLTQQIHNLVADAPADLQTSIAALAPALEQAAIELQHLQYFIGVSTTGQWIATTLQNRQSQQEIKVIYCFAKVADLQVFYKEAVSSAELPVIDLLFQLTALDYIDRLVFFDSTDVSRGRNVSKLDLQRSIEQQLKSVATLPPDNFC
jgi:endo-1,4-beta-mannosidase